MEHMKFQQEQASRIEQMFFKGATQPADDELRLDLFKPSLGLTFKRSEAKPYQLNPV